MTTKDTVNAYALIVLLLVCLLVAICALEIFGDDDAHDIATALEGAVLVGVPALISIVQGRKGGRDDTDEEAPSRIEREPTGAHRREPTTGTHRVLDEYDAGTPRDGTAHDTDPDGLRDSDRAEGR